MVDEKQLSFADIWSGKMFPAHSQAPAEETEKIIPEKISKPSFQRLSGSQSQNALMCLCLRKENGPKRDASTMNWGGWSVAWRVHDSQWWGLPQRRKRIALLADFGGLTAPEIMFDPQYRRTTEDGTPIEAFGCTGAERGCKVRTFSDGLSGDPETSGKTREGASGAAGNSPEEKSCNNQPIMVEMTSTKNTVIEDGICTTLTARMGTGGNQVNAVCFQDAGQSNDIRKLTPLEVERMQGFPDGWTDIGTWTDTSGKRHRPSDSARYKALGNSIAIPFWFWLLRRISAQYERPATLGSLFDGIGGFPLCWERCNGRGTALWASEIEEFPIAVTKLRFPDE